MNNDIVTRLRNVFHNDKSVELMNREAADEIERLRKEAFHLAANQCHAGYAGEFGHHRCGELDKLTKERDEARWEVCGFHHLTGFLAGDYAISRGWNYFNDERKWPKFSPSVTDFQEFLRGQEQISEESIARRDARIKELETLIAACLYEGISGVLRSDGTTDLVDGGCGCCSDRPKHLTEEQKALIADILKRNKK